jgi:hypothetical protein
LEGFGDGIFGYEKYSSQHHLLYLWSIVHLLSSMSISTEIEPFPSPKSFLEQIQEVSLNRHPVVVYLARLSPGSVRTMLGALNTMANILSSGRHHALSLDWSQLTHHETDLLASQLRIRYAPATVNKFQAASKAA